jgi:hypothetical protein
MAHLLAVAKARHTDPSPEDAIHWMNKAGGEVWTVLHQARDRAAHKETSVDIEALGIAEKRARATAQRKARNTPEPRYARLLERHRKIREQHKRGDQ